MLKRKLSILLIIAFTLATVACGANFAQNSYRTLATSAAGYQTAKGIANDLYIQGKITEVQKVEINELARKWRVAYHVAVDALELYDKGITNVDDVTAAMLKVSDLLAEIEKIVKKGN